MWGVVDDLGEIGGDALDAAGKFVNGAIEGAEDLANTASDAVQAIYHGINEVQDAFADAMDWLGDTLEQAGKDFLEWLDKRADGFIKAIEDLKSGIEDVIEGIDDALQKVLSYGNKLKEFFFEALAAAVDWVHDAMPDPVQWIMDDAIPFMWARVKLVAALAILVAMWPTALAAILICQQIATIYGKEHGTVLQQILKGNPRYADMLSIRRLPSGGKYFIFSDLHLYTAGKSNAVAFQETMPLYLAALQYYAVNGFYLIENGDVEDYWLRGGSLYGDMYDLANGLPAPYLDKAFNEAQVLAAAKFHLHTIVDQNKQLYALIRTAFYDQNRYSRTVGNHDDIYSHPKMVEALRYFYPHIQVHDYVVLENNGNGVGVIGHGHQTDAWDMEGCSFLGKVVTSLGSAVRDISFGELKIGITDEKKTNSIWNFDSYPNIMDELNPWLGVNAQLGNLDEVRLFRAMKKTWKTGENLWTPFVLLAHTHVPLAAPIAPHNEGRWWRYANSGCGMFKRMITGLEWDGTVNADLPRVRLVAWRYKDDIGEPGGGVKRKELADLV
jgi:hypothetical protein